LSAIDASTSHWMTVRAVPSQLAPVLPETSTT
jgi:hypothetical protein